MTPRHRPYWSSTLREEFCVECGDNWPCLPFRKATGCPVCGHKPHGRVCYSGPCGCAEMSDRSGTVPPGQRDTSQTRFSERYDPSPEPIDRSNQ